MEHVCCRGKERTTYTHVSVQRSEAYHDVAGCGTATKRRGTQQSKSRSGTAKPSAGLVPSEESYTRDAPKHRREILEKAKSRGQKSDCCRKADPFQGPKLGSCLTLGNELSEETHVLTKQETLLGKGTRVESSRVREPRRTALLCGSQSQVLW